MVASAAAIKASLFANKRLRKVGVLRRRVIQACCALLAVGLPSQNRSRISSPPVRWTVFYGQSADEHLLSSYNLVMLDPGFGGSVTAVAKAGARVCAYLSLGEIRAADPFYNRVDEDALLGENPAWPGTFRVDVRSRSWHALVLEHIIPAIYTRKFSGLLLDTLDTPHHLEYLDPERYGGMRQAAIELVHEIRRSYPHKLIFANRGYAMLADVLDCIDGVIAEGLLTRSDPSLPDSYKWNRSSEIALQLSQLSPARDGRGRLQILSLDYWDPKDPATIRKIYADARMLGFQPYVATRLLDRILPEPA